MIPFDEQVLARVRDAVVEAERKTAGEIRVLLVERSRALDWRIAIVFGAATAGGAYAALREEAWGYPGAWEVAVALFFGAIVGLFGALAAGRLRGPERAVRRRAEREFVRLGIARTAARTGVLIMLSIAERRAIVLADRGIDEKVERGTWEALVARLAAALREGRAGEGLEAAVREAGEVLAKHFPRRPDDVNELPDEVEVRK